MKAPSEIISHLYDEALDQRLSRSTFVSINYTGGSQDGFPYYLILISEDKKYAARIVTQRNPYNSKYVDFGYMDQRNAFTGVDVDLTQLYYSEDGILTFDGGQMYSGQYNWDAKELRAFHTIPAGDLIEDLTLRAEHGRSGYADSYDSATALKNAVPEFFPESMLESEPEELQELQPAIVNNITNNVTNVINETNNNTNVSINNEGSGNINVGNIGAVNNTTNIDNSFTIQTTNINLSLAITGDSKKSEKVEGTDGDDLIADGRGKDKLIGGDGADQFYFAGEKPFKKKTVDKVIDFDASEGDAIVIAMRLLVA